MFDEAQLSNEDSRRGLYFDSIVRRCQSAYPNAKFVFAHPFVKNPEAQITKNHFARETSLGIQYKLKNVGQMFFCRDGDSFYHFGIEKNIMGNQRILCKFDPLENAIRNSGSILVYVTKSSIYNKKIVSEFKKYIDLCDPIKDRSALGLISQLQHYVGGSYKSDRNLYSQMLDLMRRGIVIHHGSLPLEARLIIEKFTQEGFCKICFATSTLEQGINMPFEIVYLHKFEASRQLALKNLIGRAGRSSDSDKFDFGSVIVRKNCMTAFRKIMLEDEVMKDISSIDDTEIHDDDFNEFREAIRNNTISDEYNLTQKEVENLSSDNVKKIISNILEAMFLENSLLPLAVINKDINNKLALYACFAALYACHLGRALVVGEETVLRSCEDIDETALSYAEVKALATGNPHIKEKMDLEIDVSRLKLVKANYQSQKYAMEDRLLKYFPRELKTTEERLAGFKEDIALYEQHKSEDFPGMELCGTIYAEKKDAGAALIETCKAQTNPAAREVGSFRGFGLLLSYDTFSKVFKLTLKGALSHTIDLGSDIHGNIQRMENAFEMLPTRLAACEQALANLYTQIENAKAEVEKPFAQEEELKTKSARLAELDSMLNMDKRENDTLDGEPEQEDERVRKREDYER